MLTFDAPNVPPIMTEAQSAYVMVDASRRSDSVGEFGYCMIADDLGGGSVSLVKPFEKMIPPRVAKALRASARLGVSVLEPGDEEWLAKWQESFSVKVLHQPEYGEIRLTGDSMGYLPKSGYLGNDRVDVLVDGKAPDGRPISARARIFVRVVSDAERMSFLRNNDKERVYIKRNFPAQAKFWKIDRQRG